jgi:hypothetical protein
LAAAAAVVERDADAGAGAASAAVARTAEAAASARYAADAGEIIGRAKIGRRRSVVARGEIRDRQIIRAADGEVHVSARKIERVVAGAAPKREEGVKDKLPHKLLLVPIIHCGRPRARSRLSVA